MRRLTLLVTAALVAALASSSSAQLPVYPQNGYIGLYQDAAATQCCISSGAASTTLYVIATLAGGSTDGITGAEFRLQFANPDGTDPVDTYDFIWIVNPAAAGASMGNPVDVTPSDSTDATGANVVFPSCQPTVPGSTTLVRLGTVRMLLANGGPLIVETKMKTEPSNAAFKCPLFVLCDSPVFTMLPITITKEVNGGKETVAFTSYINWPGCTGCGPVAAVPQTWSEIKGLYR